MKSNQNGRALEYALVATLQERYGNAYICEQTERDQTRDSGHFANLPQEMQGYYRQQCAAFANWVAANKVSDQGPVSIRRIADRAAMKGDVTDIRLSSATQQYNISLKHNNNAVKHQRPGNLFAQLGLVDKAEEKQYRAAIKAISAQFFSQVMPLNTLLFSEVKSQDETIIQSFYQQMCHLVTDTINSQPVDPQKAFDFLVGNCNFDKVIVCRDHVQVMQFSHIAKPQSLQAKQTSANHIQLDFDNGFSFDMRLHTASSKFALGKTINQKFDTRLISDSVQSFTL